MLLRPRKFIFKNRQKKRNFLNSKCSNFLNYGQVGLKLLQPTKLFSKQMFRFKLYIKKGSRRSDRTGRKCWFSAFPHLPLTRKVSGSRMGKGKGKLKDWVTQLPAGVNIIEYKNLRYGRSIYFLRQMQFKIRSKSMIIRKYKYTTLPYSSGVKVPFERRW